ncbi:MAG: hypothetical protein JOZ74_15650 [Bradyrhizobium sp.]|nr:hypothetical protein [Bradyrhizobium sp.]
MSTDFSIRPVGAPAPSPVIQPVSQAASNGVMTELPASQSVSAADAGTVARNDPQLLSYDVSHQAYYDRAAGAMVYQEVDEKTDQVMDQYPDEAVLRRRAYFHALEMSKDDQPHVIPTDVVA